MNKTTLINALAERGYTKADAKRFLNDLTDVLNEGFTKGESLTLSGLFTIKPKITRQTKRCNISTGNIDIVPPSKSLKIRVFKELRGRL